MSRARIVYLANNRFSFVYFSSQRTLQTEKEETSYRRFILYTFLVSGGLLNVKILLLLKESIENKKAFQIRWRGNSSTYLHLFNPTQQIAWCYSQWKKCRIMLVFCVFCTSHRLLGKVLAKAVWSNNYFVQKSRITLEYCLTFFMKFSMANSKRKRKMTNVRKWNKVSWYNFVCYPYLLSWIWIPYFLK